MLVGYSIKLIMVVVLYLYMWNENKKRDREAAIVPAADANSNSDVVEAAKGLEAEAIEAGMRDETEIDNKGFRYTL
jgi:hypothetical protein